MPTIFGREPAVWLTLIATIIRVVAALGVDLSDDQQAILNAVAAAAAGLITAVMVRDGQVAAVLGLTQAVIALAVGFGLNLNAEHQALLMSVAGLITAMFVRTQVTPKTPAAGVS